MDASKGFLLPDLVHYLSDSLLSDSLADLQKKDFGKIFRQIFVISA